MTSKSVDKGYKPLETLTIEVNGNPVPALIYSLLIKDSCSQLKIEALKKTAIQFYISDSSYFAETRLMVPFLAPPKLTRNGQFTMGAKDSWLHKMNIFKSNIEWLLGLNHHKFWSQIVYGAETWDAVVSFLQEAHPFYAADSLPEDEEIMTVYHQIYLLVFKAIKRAMTRIESEMSYIGKKYGSLLYNYTIISVPMMIDICVLYGHHFHKETKEMIANIFAAQPLYTKDLENSVQTIKAAFSIVEEKFTGQSVATDEITKLAERVRIVKTLPVHDLQDVVFYLLDISASLACFIEVYEEAALVLHNHKFETYISRLYENAFPPAVHQVQDCCDNDDTMSLYFILMLKLNNARFYFIKLFRLCVKASLKMMFEKRSEAAGSQAYLDIMTECLPCSIFIKDYHSKYPIDHDLDAIAQNCPDFDNIKYNFLLESLLACFNQPTKQKSTEPCFRREGEPKVENRDRQNLSEVPPIYGSSSTTTPTLAVIQSKISEVKDCLPHLGDGYILKCLEHYDMTPTAAIMAILEETLPEEIKSIDIELPFIPPEQGQPALPQVYGEGEYENMCQDFETEFVAHIGKRQGQQKELKELLDDKSELRGCMDRFSQLGIIESMDDVYDDEYDDTYDDSELPVPEVEETDRKFVVPRILQQGRRRGGSGEEEEANEGEEEDESEEQKRQRNYMNFVENPEDVRARYQQKRLTNMKYPPAPKKDVVGNAKGQGQEKEVLRNRQQKTLNKSANRKKAAQFKKSKGMF